MTPLLLQLGLDMAVMAVVFVLVRAYCAARQRRLARIKAAAKTAKGAVTTRPRLPKMQCGCVTGRIDPNTIVVGMDLADDDTATIVYGHVDRGRVHIVGTEKLRNP